MTVAPILFHTNILLKTRYISPLEILAFKKIHSYDFITMREDDSRLQNAVRTVEAAVLGIPLRENLSIELAMAERAQQRGWFTPDEDEAVRACYSYYLSSRSALLTTLSQLEDTLKNNRRDWESQLPYFVTAFAAACLTIRGSLFIIELAKKRPVIWKKLDEAESRYGLPRKTFTSLHKAATLPARRRQFSLAVTFYDEYREQIYALAENPLMAPLIEILKAEEPFMNRNADQVWRSRLFYQWFSFLRSNRSGYHKVMFQLFRWSGSAIAELRQPGIKHHGAPKRINEAQRQQLLALARPGDVFITRHDDAMSNLFLPGFWPHAALHLGSPTDLVSLVGPLAAAVVSRYKPDHRFLEAKKDGVHFRSGEETLHVDACLLLRPPLGDPHMAEALLRALSHEGKLYDFLFDFRTTDRLACTEVIYRTFHGFGPVQFQLIQKAGRACIPAENMIDQALACGFILVASCNVTEGRVNLGENALADLALSRKQSSRA